MKKRIISLILVLTMLFNVLPVFSIYAAAENNNNLIGIRIEGSNETLFNEKIEFTEEIKSPLDVLRKGVGSENIDGSESSYGYFITEILGEQQRANTGWSYYVKFKNGEIVQPMVAVDKFLGLTDSNGNLNCEELVFYMTSYSGANILTKIPAITVEEENGRFTIKVVNNEVGSNPMKDVDIEVIGERKYKTDENGQVSFSLKKAGVYNILISKDC